MKLCRRVCRRVCIKFRREVCVDPAKASTEGGLTLQCVDVCVLNFAEKFENQRKHNITYQ
jgi:hypothetical protein